MFYLLSSAAICYCSVKNPLLGGKDHIIKMQALKRELAIKKQLCQQWDAVTLALFKVSGYPDDERNCDRLIKSCYKSPLRSLEEDPLRLVLHPPQLPSIQRLWGKGEHPHFCTHNSCDHRQAFFTGDRFIGAKCLQRCRWAPSEIKKACNQAGTRAIAVCVHTRAFNPQLMQECLT